MGVSQKKKEIITALIDIFRKFRFCAPTDEPGEITNVTAGFRHFVIQFQRLVAPILLPPDKERLERINAAIDDLYAAYDAHSEIEALLPDIQAALEILDHSAMPLEQPFSKRNRYSGAAKEIAFREDAPENLRYFALQTAIDLDFGPCQLRDVICRVLRAVPDSSDWGPNIWNEVE
jgi:hypothetical protein